MNDEISIIDLVHKIAKILDKKIEIVFDKKRVRPKKSEVNRLLCDNTKLVKNTKWKPKYNLDKGLKETLNWIIRNQSKFKSNIYNF